MSPSKEIFIHPSLPFKCSLDHELSRWRADTFWDKEPETLAWIRASVAAETNLHFIDVGANLGLYSLYALSLSPNLTVTSVEPSIHNFPALQRNVELNPELVPRVECLSVPLSNFEGVGYWEEVSERLGDSGHQFKRESSGSADLVQTTTGDSIVQSVPVNIKIMVKIDVDGTELSILEGFSNALATGRVSTLLVELEQDQFSDAEGFFITHGYEEDIRFDSTPGHSAERRLKQGSTVRNWVFRPKQD